MAPKKTETPVNVLATVEGERLNEKANNALTVFEPNAVAEFGNKVLAAILLSDMAKDQAEQDIADAGRRDQIVNTEMVRAAMHMHREDLLNAHNVFGDRKEAEGLYRVFLLRCGVLKAEFDDATGVATYSYTDPSIADEFDLSGLEKDTPEYRKRHSRRNALNARLQRIMKTAVALIDAEATPDDIENRENKETGETEVILRKGPAEVMGTAREVVISTTARKPVDGAKYTPSLTGLAKAATDARKKADAEPTSAAKQEGAASDTTSGQAATGIVSEEDFLATMNAAMQMVKRREGKFSKPEQSVMANLAKLLSASVPTAA